MEENWNVFKYGEWSAEHGMYEEIRELTRVTEEVANDYILSSDEPMCAYLIGPFGNAVARLFNERGAKCYRKSLNTKMD